MAFRYSSPFSSWSWRDLWRNPYRKKEKAEKVNFYLRHKLLGKWNLFRDFQRVQIYSIAHKKQKRIMAGTHWGLKTDKDRILAIGRRLGEGLMKNYFS